MSLAPGEQETLTEIENSLCQSDPRLAGMFAAFRKQAYGRQGPARELLSPWRSRPRRTGQLLLLAIVLVCFCVIVAAL